MDIGEGGVEWERFTPLKEYPDITCEIKRLDLLENIEFKESHETSKGKIGLTFDSPAAREVFKKYVRNIEGLTAGKRKLEQPSDIFSPKTPPHDLIHILLIATAVKWWDINMVSHEEEVGLEVPSVSSGSRAAKKDEAK